MLLFQLPRSKYPISSYMWRFICLYEPNIISQTLPTLLFPPIQTSHDVSQGAQRSQLSLGTRSPEREVAAIKKVADARKNGRRRPGCVQKRNNCERAPVHQKMTRNEKSNLINNYDLIGTKTEKRAQHRNERVMRAIRW